MDLEKVKKSVEEKIDVILEQEIRPDNLDSLGKLVDIHKDLANEEYWKEKIDMRYMRGNYGADRGYGADRNYGARRRDSRGRYMGNNYRGDEMMDEMREHYGNYMEGRENYGGEETEKAFDYMLQSAEDFFTYLMEESDSPEQMEKIKRTARRISEMRM